jgi:hypothetical protein
MTHTWRRSARTSTHTAPTQRQHAPTKNTCTLANKSFTLYVCTVAQTLKNPHIMKTYIVFGTFGDYLTDAPTWIAAVQSAIAARGGSARDWTAHDLATYPAHLQARILARVAS